MLVPYFEFDLLFGENANVLPIEHLYLGPTSSVELSMNSIRMFLAKSGINPGTWCRILPDPLSPEIALPRNV